MKLRRHIKLIQEKICKNDGNSEIKINVDEVLSLINEDSIGEDTNKDETTNDEDLVGAKVAYLEPDLEENQEENDPENITLPVESEEMTTKEACTLTTINQDLKKEMIDDEEELINEVEQTELFIIPGMEQEQEEEHEQDQSSPIISQVLKNTFLTSAPSYIKFCFLLEL